MGIFDFCRVEILLHFNNRHNAIQGINVTGRVRNRLAFADDNHAIHLTAQLACIVRNLSIDHPQIQPVEDRPIQEVLCESFVHISDNRGVIDAGIALKDQGLSFDQRLKEFGETMNHSDIITRLIEQARNKKKRCQNTFPKGLANAPFLLGFIGSCCCRCTIVWQSVEPAEGTLRNGRRKAEKLHEGLRKRGKRSVGRNLTGTQATEA